LEINSNLVSSTLVELKEKKGRKKTMTSSADLEKELYNVLSETSLDGFERRRITPEGFKSSSSTTPKQIKLGRLPKEVELKLKVENLRGNDEMSEIQENPCEEMECDDDQETNELSKPEDAIMIDSTPFTLSEVRKIIIRSEYQGKFRFGFFLKSFLYHLIYTVCQPAILLFLLIEGKPNLIFQF
jgi:hypothetical protein